MTTYDDDPLAIPDFLRRTENATQIAAPARARPEPRHRWIMPKGTKRQRKTDEQRLGLRILGYSDKQASGINHDEAERIIRGSISPARWHAK